MTYLKNNKPYGPNCIHSKYECDECVGHVQKHMGKKLRDLRKTAVMVDVPTPPTPKPSARGKPLILLLGVAGLLPPEP